MKLSFTKRKDVTLCLLYLVVFPYVIGIPGQSMVHRGICGLEGRTDASINQVILHRRDGSSEAYGGNGGGAQCKTQYCAYDESIIRVSWCDNPSFCGQELTLHTSKGRSLTLRGYDPAVSMNQHSEDIGPGECFMGLAWSNNNAADRGATITGILREPCRVMVVGGRVGADLDSLDLCMEDGSARHYGGMTGGEYPAVELESGRGECLTKVEALHFGDYRGALRFTTSSGRTIAMPEGRWRNVDVGSITTYEAPQGQCIVGLRWDTLVDTRRKGRLQGIITAPAPQPAPLYRGAAIGNRGLSEPTDELERFALRSAGALLGEDADVVRNFSQCYGRRHHQLSPYMDKPMRYSPPTTGLIPGTNANVIKVVKVGMRNPNVDAVFNGGAPFQVVYHGAVARGHYNTYPEAPRLRLRPSTRGAHGQGCYVTASFSMALRYSYYDWNGRPRFATSPDVPYPYSLVFMCTAPQQCAKGHGTAYREYSDGWADEELEWVVPPSDLQIYGLLYCFYTPDPQGHFVVDDSRVGSRHVAEQYEGGPFSLSWLSGVDAGVRRKCNKTDNNDGRLRVTRTTEGHLLGCNFCCRQAPPALADIRPQEGQPDRAFALATAFWKQENNRVLCLPVTHLPGIGCLRFWDMPSHERRLWLWHMKKKALMVSTSTVLLDCIDPSAD